MRKRQQAFRPVGFTLRPRPKDADISPPATDTTALLIALAWEITDRALPEAGRSEVLLQTIEGAALSQSTPDLIRVGFFAMLEEVGPGLGEAARLCMGGVALDTALSRAGVPATTAQAMKPEYLAIAEGLKRDLEAYAGQKGGK